MKATRKTIPTLIEQREEFTNTSGTVKGVKPTSPLIRAILSKDSQSQLDDTERSRLMIDAGPACDRIAYLIMSYNTPIAWETKSGHTYKVEQKFSQTTSQHMGLLYLFHERHADI